MLGRKVLVLVACSFLTICGVFSEALAQGSTGVPSPTVSPAGKQWFEIGYRYSTASSAGDIGTLRAQLPGKLPQQLLQSLSEWEAKPKDGSLKAKVRPLLLMYAKSYGGYQAIEFFRFGEWYAELVDALTDFMLAVIRKDDNALLSSTVRIRILAEEAQRFIDVLSGDVPVEIIKSLEQIKASAAAIDILAIVAKKITVEEFGRAVLGLPDLLGPIKETFRL